MFQFIIKYENLYLIRFVAKRINCGGGGGVGVMTSKLK